MELLCLCDVGLAEEQRRGETQAAKPWGQARVPDRFVGMT